MFESLPERGVVRVFVFGEEECPHLLGALYGQAAGTHQPGHDVVHDGHKGQALAVQQDTAWRGMGAEKAGNWRENDAKLAVKLAGK